MNKVLQTFVRNLAADSGKLERTRRAACDSKLVSAKQVKAAQLKQLPGYVSLKSLLGR